MVCQVIVSRAVNQMHWQRQIWFCSFGGVVGFPGFLSMKGATSLEVGKCIRKYLHREEGIMEMNTKVSLPRDHPLTPGHRLGHLSLRSSHVISWGCLWLFLSNPRWGQVLVRALPGETDTRAVACFRLHLLFPITWNHQRDKIAIVPLLCS